jgi:hypothetical protein
VTRRRWTAAWAIPAACAVLVAGMAPGAGRASAVPVAATGEVDAAAREAVGSGELRVRIQEFSPDIPTEPDTLRISALVTNTGDLPARDVAAHLRVSPSQLSNRNEIPEVIAGAGNRLGEVQWSSHKKITSSLAPGASVPIRLEAPVDTLPLGSAGVFVVGVEILGDTGSGVMRQDIDRTFLPWWPEGTDMSHLPLTTIWPVSSPPLQDLHGDPITDAPATEMSPAGRLDDLLQAVVRNPGAVSLVIDPLTLTQANDLAAGYRVHEGGALVPGARSAEAGRWLRTATKAILDPANDARGMLPGLPDLVAARRGHLLRAALEERERSDSETTAILGRPLDASVALPPGGLLDPGTADRLAQAGVTLVALDDSALPLAQPDFFTPSGFVRLVTANGVLPALLSDAGMTAALAMPMATPSDRTAARQRLLAETLTTIAELPDTPRLIVAVPPSGWDPTGAGARMVTSTIATTPWIDPTPVSEALAREPSTLPRGPLQYSAEDAAVEIDPSRARGTRRHARGLADYSRILADSANHPRSADTVRSRGISSWWRSDPETGDALDAVLTEQIDELHSSVRVLSSGSITVSGSRGTIPVTVENVGPAPVLVGLGFVARPAQLFQADDVAPFRIDPGRRRSVEVEAEITAADLIPVEIEIRAPDGEAFGVPGQLTVRSSAYADAARVLVQVALAGLLLAVAVHGVRRARRKRHQITVPAEGFEEARD